MSENLAYKQGYDDTAEWLDCGAPPSAQPRPPHGLTKQQCADWWKGSHAAFEVAKKDAVFQKQEDIIMSLIMFLFFLFGLYLLISGVLFVKIAGALVAWFSGVTLIKYDRRK